MKNERITGRFTVRSYRILIVILLVQLIVSCEDDIPLGTIEVSVDGSRKEFSNGAKAEWINVEGGYGLKIIGYRGTEGSSNEVSITIASPRDISTGAYTNSVAGNAVVVQFYVYLLFNFDEFTSGSATVSISELDSSHVKGTFKASLKDSGGSTREFEDGVFNVSF